MGNRNRFRNLKSKRLISLLLFYLFTFLPLCAQFNTDRLIAIGRSALYYEDYVLSIQYFNQGHSQVLPRRLCWSRERLFGGY